MQTERIAPQSEVTRAIVSEDSPRSAGTCVSRAVCVLCGTFRHQPAVGMSPRTPVSNHAERTVNKLSGLIMADRFDKTRPLDRLVWPAWVQLALPMQFSSHVQTNKTSSYKTPMLVC